PPIVSISMTRESPSTSGLSQWATGIAIGVRAGRAGATAIVLFCATVIDAKGVAAFVTLAKCTGALSLLAAAATLPVGDDTRSAAVTETGSAAFCVTTTPNPASPNVSNAAKTTTTMRIATSI